MKNIIMILLTLATFMVSLNCASWKQVNANNPTEQSTPRWAIPVENTWSQEPVMEIAAPIVIDEEIKPDLKELERLNNLIADLESFQTERTLKLDSAKIGSSIHKQLISEIDALRWKILNKKKIYNLKSVEIGNEILKSVGLPDNFDILNEN